MTTVQCFTRYFVCLLPFIFLIKSKEINPPPKPEFPDVFQVEVTGIFVNENKEVDGVIYYDKKHNIARVTYTYENDTTTSIYNFTSSQQIYIDGTKCSVAEIDDKESRSFFPYHVDKVTKKKTIAPAEELFFFTQSKFDDKASSVPSVVPTYVFFATMDIKQYGFKQCNVTHIFSKPELEMPDCEDRMCKPTLVSIIVICPPRKDDDDDDKIEIRHTYNFHRFRSAIKDDSVFKIPAGIHCNVNSSDPFPEFPRYFSFSYELIDEQKWEDSSGVYVYRKKVWYDTKLNLIRMDEYDDDGLLVSSRIFDFYGETGYVIIASEATCTFSDFDGNVDLDKMTRLPKILFAKTEDDRKKAVYIGKRSVNRMVYDVWTMSNIDPLSDAKVIQEFYFTNNFDLTLEESKGHLQLSHVNIYTYERSGGADSYQLSLVTYLTLSNYRSSPKEWEAFDVSSCFSGNQKKGFSLKVDGPPVIKYSHLYETLLEKLYTRLIILTNASVVRISELDGIFDGVEVTQFSGWILNTPERNKTKSKNPEHDMESTYNIIENAAAAGKLIVKLNNTGETQIYNVTAVFPVVPKVPETESKTCFTGGVVAVVGLVLLLVGFSFSAVGYYVFFKKKTSSGNGGDKMHMSSAVDFN